MMFEKGGRTAKVALLLFVLILILGWWLGSLLILVREVPQGKVFVYSCAKGDVFQIRLRHSVEKTPWEDNFMVRNAGDLLLTTSKFESLGWGYPYSEADGKFNIDQDKKFLVTLNRPFPKVNTCISVQAMPKFLYNGIVLDLCREFGDGAFVEIRVVKRYQWLLKKLNKGGI